MTYDEIVAKVAEDNGLSKRLDYLFKVVELATTFKDADFVNSCIDEIKEAMTPAPEEEDKKE